RDRLERAKVLMPRSKPEKLLSDRGDDRVVVPLFDHSLRRYSEALHLLSDQRGGWPIELAQRQEEDCGLAAVWFVVRVEVPGARRCGFVRRDRRPARLSSREEAAMHR